jgi:hypothetical protein
MSNITDALQLPVAEIIIDRGGYFRESREELFDKEVEEYYVIPVGDVSVDIVNPITHLTLLQAYSFTDISSYASSQIYNVQRTSAEVLVSSTSHHVGRGRNDEQRTTRSDTRDSQESIETIQKVDSRKADQVQQDYT